MRNYDLHSRLGYRVSRLSRTMQARLDRCISKYGITRLADDIGITLPATSRLLRTMETRGLLERSYGGNDGRMIEVRLSARGAEVLALARKGVDAVNDHFTAKLTPEEMQQFLNAVEKLTADENEQLTNL
jgi:DNA-binding MarR family transcriptional regulator